MNISTKDNLLNKIKQDLKFKNYYLCKIKTPENINPKLYDTPLRSVAIGDIENLITNIYSKEDINDIVEWIINFDKSLLILIFKLVKSNILDIKHDKLIEIQSKIDSKLYTDLFNKLLCVNIKNNNYEFLNKILNYYRFWINNIDDLYIAAKKNIAMLSIICSNYNKQFPSIKVIQNMIKTGYITNAIYLLSFDDYIKYFYRDIYYRNTVTDVLLYDLYYNTIIKYKSYRLFIVLYEKFGLPQKFKLDKFILVNNQYKIANYILNINNNINNKTDYFYYDDIVELHNLDKYSYIEILKVFNNKYLPIKNGGYKIYRFMDN
jgi:hypothetical protein